MEKTMAKKDASEYDWRERLMHDAIVANFRRVL
jgi:hypothetical protein